MRWRRPRRGLSEIVGTLMLVVIVVGAATALGAFVASYQKELQQQRSLAHEQSLESLRILGLSSALDPAGTAFQNLSFIVASEFVDPSTVVSISVNNAPLVRYTWENLTSSVWHSVQLGNGAELTLAPEQEILVSTNLSMSFSGPAPLPNHYLKIDVYTILLNDFGRIFLPPTALAVVSETSPAPNLSFVLLDGSTSFQSGGNLSIVEWNWVVTGGGLPSGTNLTKTGEIVQVPTPQNLSCTPAQPCSVTLQTLNSAGLVASTTVYYEGP